MDILKKLNFADCLSLISLFFAWLSIILLLLTYPNLAIVSNLFAFVFDLSDGYFARRLKLTSDLGRQLDSSVDVLTYLVFSALLYFKYLAPNLLLGILVGFLILSFGILRLIRFNNEGILKNMGGDYYRGVTVVHINLIVLLSYFLSKYTNFWHRSFTAILLLVASPLMLSSLKSYKIKNYLFLVVIILILIILSLNLEYGYFK